MNVRYLYQYDKWRQWCSVVEFPLAIFKYLTYKGIVKDALLLYLKYPIGVLLTRSTWILRNAGLLLHDFNLATPYKSVMRACVFRVSYCNKITSKHWWFSGRILACHAGGPGSIPGQCIFLFCLRHFTFYYYLFFNDNILNSMTNRFELLQFINSHTVIPLLVSPHFFQTWKSQCTATLVPWSKTECIETLHCTGCPHNPTWSMLTTHID